MAGAFGVDTHQNHLDDSSLDWSQFTGWVAGQDKTLQGPAFSGRYFLGGRFLWGDGEGAAAQTQVPSLTKIAPIHGAMRSRQEVGERTGLIFGRQDGLAMCRRLACAIKANAGGTRQFALPALDVAKVYVYLEVEAGTHLTVDYWAGWADAIYKFIFPDIGSVAAGGGGLLPGRPYLSQPFLPCIV